MKYLILLALSVSYLIFSVFPVYAAPRGSTCIKDADCEAPSKCLTISDYNGVLGEGKYCEIQNAAPGSVESAIGKIKAPAAIGNLGFGAAGISNVLSNVIQIIYIVAAIVFVFMVVISAFQWIISGGDKEKISQARGRLTNAIIGIFLLAIAFVIIRVVGQLTGFEFFSGQNNPLPELPKPPGTQDTTIFEDKERQTPNSSVPNVF